MAGRGHQCGHVGLLTSEAAHILHTLTFYVDLGLLSAESGCIRWYDGWGCWDVLWLHFKFSLLLPLLIEWRDGRLLVINILTLITVFSIVLHEVDRGWPLWVVDNSRWQRLGLRRGLGGFPFRTQLRAHVHVEHASALPLEASTRGLFKSELLNNALSLGLSCGLIIYLSWDIIGLLSNF